MKYKEKMHVCGHNLFTYKSLCRGKMEGHIRGRIPNNFQLGFYYNFCGGSKWKDTGLRTKSKVCCQVSPFCGKIKLTFSLTFVSERGLKKLHRVAAREKGDERDGGEHLTNLVSRFIKISARHGAMKVIILLSISLFYLIETSARQTPLNLEPIQLVPNRHKQRVCPRPKRKVEQQRKVKVEQQRKVKRSPTAVLHSKTPLFPVLFPVFKNPQRRNFLRYSKREICPR